MQVVTCRRTRGHYQRELTLASVRIRLLVHSGRRRRGAAMASCHYLLRLHGGLSRTAAGAPRLQSRPCCGAASRTARRPGRQHGVSAGPASRSAPQRVCPRPRGCPAKPRALQCPPASLRCLSLQPQQHALRCVEQMSQCSRARVRWRAVCCGFREKMALRRDLAGSGRQRCQVFERPGL